MALSGLSSDRLFFRIGEVARAAGVEPYVLRYWESEFPVLAPRKGKGGQRLYSREDLELVLAIRRMLHEEGYTIAGARRQLVERVAARGSSITERGAGETGGAAVENARKGLQALLHFMDNNDLLRAKTR